ncbi:MAG: hypothetical protein WC175_06530 [Candidatus Dojkabacteria bacterium]
MSDEKVKHINNTLIEFRKKVDSVNTVKKDILFTIDILPSLDDEHNPIISALITDSYRLANIIKSNNITYESKDFDVESFIDVLIRYNNMLDVFQRMNIMKNESGVIE